MSRNSPRADGRRGRREPQKLSDVIAEVIIQRGYARQLELSAFHSAWNAATDTNIAKASQPGKLRRGVLEVTVKNSTILHELTFQKKQILKKLNEQILDHSISDLRLKIGRVDNK